MTSFRSPRCRSCFALLLVVSVFLTSCGGGSGSGDTITLLTFASVDPLTAAEVDILIQRAAQAVDTPGLIVAVVDRVGRPLGIWSRNPNPTVDDVNIAVSIARTGAFMSSSQGPITSRTLEFISTYHFPATFGNVTRNPIPNNAFTLAPSLADQRQTVGVNNTPQGPLWQIFSSNRGAPFAGQDLLDAGLAGMVPTQYSAPSNGFTDMRLPSPGRVDLNGNPVPNMPGTGLTYLPGGIPIYKNGIPAPGQSPDFLARVAGGLGVYATDAAGIPQPDVAEFATVYGLGGIELDGTKKAETNFGMPAASLANPTQDLNFFFPFSVVPPQGRIFLVGVLLPYVKNPERPAGILPGAFANDGVNGLTLRASQPGGEQPFGWIIGPVADPLGNLTQADVQRIVEQGIAYANGTRAAIRVPADSATKMVFAVTNLNGEILGAYRMEDAPIFSYDVSITKARCVTYLSSYPGGNPNMDPADAALLNAAGIPTGVAGTAGEFGVAITTRTLAFLTQPFFPPGIDTSGTQPGPLFPLASQNADPNQFNRMASAAPSPGLQSGVIFFPGASPLYLNGALVGGYGVSGDGVEQDDFVTDGGYTGYEPPENIRADQFFFQGVRLPFFKFPQFPGPGADLSNFVLGGGGGGGGGGASNRDKGSSGGN